MPYIVKWKDGSSTQMDDKEFENLPSDMEGDIGSIQQTPATPTAFKPPMQEQPESSPFGAKPPVGMDPSSGHTLKEVAYDYYGRPAVAVGNFVRNNPAKSALAAGTLLTGGTSIPLAATLAVGAEAIDKFHPFNKDIRSEYESKTPADNFVDLGSAGMWGGVGQKVSNVTAGLADKSRLTVLQKALDAEGRQGAIQSADEALRYNTATKELADRIQQSRSKIGTNFKPDELTPAVSKRIRQELIAENTANGVPKRIVTNRDVQDRYIAEVQSIRDKLQTPRPNMYPPREIPEIPPEPTHKLIKGSDITNAFIGAGLGTHLGPLGTIVGGGLGAFARPVSDKIAVEASKRLPQLAGPVLKGISKSSSPIATGLGIPVSKGIVDLLRGGDRK